MAGFSVQRVKTLHAPTGYYYANRIFVTKGTKVYYGMGQYNSTPVNEFFVYDTETYITTSLALPPNTFTNTVPLKCFIVGNKIWCFTTTNGGYTGSNLICALYYDIDLNTWTIKSGMSAPTNNYLTNSICLSSDESKIYIIVQNWLSYQTNLYSYTLSNGSFVQVSYMPRYNILNNSVLFMIGSKVYVNGGSYNQHSTGGSIPTDTAIYDTSSALWTAGVAVPTNQMGLYSCTTTSWSDGTYGYVMNPQLGTTVNNVYLYRFNPNTNVWDSPIDFSRYRTNGGNTYYDKTNGYYYFAFGTTSLSDVLVTTYLECYKYWLDVPTNLTISNVGNQAVLNWTDVSTEETAYLIERRDAPSATYTQIGSVGAGITTFTDTTSNINTASWYRVVAQKVV